MIFGMNPIPISNTAVHRSSVYIFNAGTIPPQYSVLTSLVQLRVSGNALSGSLPPQLSTLVALDVLETNTVLAMGGPLPAEYSELTNLTRL
jgi:hypothetical protein